MVILEEIISPILVQLRYLLLKFIPVCFMQINWSLKATIVVSVAARPSIFKILIFLSPNLSSIKTQDLTVELYQFMTVMKKE
jgi:hypothetical protein